MSICLLLFLFYIYKSDSLRITLMLNKKLNVTCWNNCVIEIIIEWYKLQIIKSTPRIFTNIIFTFVKKYNLLVYSLINESRFSIFKLERVHNCSNMAHVLGLQQMLIRTLVFFLIVYKWTCTSFSLIGWKCKRVIQNNAIKSHVFILWV